MNVGGQNSFQKMTRESVDAHLMYVTLSLYSISQMARSSVTDVVEIFNKFFSFVFIPLLQTQFKNHFQSDTLIKQIFFVLEQNKDLFKDYLSEHMRFNQYEKKSLFVRPTVFEIGQELVDNADRTEMIKQPVYAAYVPLKDSLKKMLERPGFYSQVIEYIKSSSEETMLTNRMQGKLQKTKYDSKDVQRLLLDLYCDEFETRNPLGSHSGQEKMAGVFVSLACLPPHLAGKLENILVSVICHAKHIKTFGNEKVFRKTIEDLNDLSENGLTINADGKTNTLHFDFSLVLGDNLGLNSYCGFSKSFNANYYCRICSGSKYECRKMTKENETLVRTVKSYENDLMSGKDPSETGIYERCIFNDIKNFHICENNTIDVMHDVYKGVACFTLSKVLQSLIEQKIVTLDQINHRIATFHYNENDVNKPMPIQYSVSKKGKDKLKIRQSAAEMRCLTRYLILMIGDLIPTDNKNWKLYLYLRRIVGILHAPKISVNQVFLLQELIEKFNSLYIELYDHLKPKIHNMVHYPRIIFLNGPVEHYSSAKYERKNKQLKEYAASTCSNRNLPLTIAIRHQLQQAFISKFSPVPKGHVQLGQIADHDAGKLLKDLIPQFDSSKSVQIMKSVSILGKLFKQGTIIVSEINETGPNFGRINTIFFCEGQVYFHINQFVTNYFHKNYHAYNVTTIDDIEKVINVDMLPKLPPCTLIKKQNMELVATSYDF